MFDPQKAEPVFLEIVKRMPKEGVEVLGETIRHLIGGDFPSALSAVVSGRRQIPETEPVQKPLAALQQTVMVHNRLHEIGAPIPVDRIWAKTAPEAPDQARETTVSHDVQKAMADEIRHQVARIGSGDIACPGCGGRDHASVGRAPLVHLEDPFSSHDQKTRALTRLIDPAPLVGILRNDIANSDADTDTTLSIALTISARDRLSLPVARCGTCSLIFVATRLRAADDAGLPDGNSASLANRGGAGTTFLSAFEQALLPHFTWCESDVWAGAAVYEFGCGSGASLSHHAMIGMRVSGYEDEPSRHTYAREIFGLTDVAGDRAALDAVDSQSMTCVTCDLALERTPNLGANLDSLCRMVAKNGHLVVVAQNGSLMTPGDSAAGSNFDQLGGRHLHSLTPTYLAQQLSDRGLQVVRALHGPTRLEDPSFPIAQRDPFTGVPVWSARPGNSVLVAKRP